MEKNIKFDIAFPLMEEFLEKVSGRICYNASNDEYMNEVMIHLRSFSQMFYKGCYDEIVCEFQKISGHRSVDKLSKEEWGEMLQIEENALKTLKSKERGFANALLRMSRANKLCCTDCNYEETHIIFNWINNENLFTVFRQALRLNILLSETFPDTLKPQFEAWLKGEEVPEPGQAQGEENQGKNFANEEKLVGDIKNCFIGYDNKKAEDLAREFLHKIKGMKKATDITDLVRDWRGKGWISPNSCGKPLFAPLHDAGIYKPKTVQNWNQQINNK